MNILKNRQKMSARDLALIAVFAGFVAALGLTPKLTLPGTPVPVTLQSFGVMLTGALIGWRRAGLAMLLFVGLVALFPVLPGGRGGLSAFVSPLVGYLVGFILGAMVIGAIVEAGRSTPVALLRAIQVLSAAAAVPLALRAAGAITLPAFDEVNSVALILAVVVLVLCSVCAQVVIGRTQRSGSVSRKYTYALSALAVLVGGLITVYACGVVGMMIILNMSFMKALVVGAVPFVPGDLIKGVLVVLIAESVHRGYPALIGGQNRAVAEDKVPVSQ